MTIEITPPTEQPASYNAYFNVRGENGHTLTFSAAQSQMCASYFTTGQPISNFGCVPQPVAMTRWRIAESGGELLLRVSTDGVTYTTTHTITTPATLDVTRVQALIGTYSTDTPNRVDFRVVGYNE